MSELELVLFIFSRTVLFEAMEEERRENFCLEELVFGKGEANDG